MSLKIKQERLRGMDVPDEPIGPGTPVTVRVNLKNEAGTVAAWDPDECGDPGTPCDGSSSDRNGYCVHVFVDHPGGQEERITCHKFNFIGTNNKSVPVTFTVPERTGDYEVSAHIELPGGSETEISDEVVYGITVSDESPTQPPSDPGDDNGDNDDEEEGKNLTQLIVENPVGAGVLFIGGTVALREAISVDE